MAVSQFRTKAGVLGRPARWDLGDTLPLAGSAEDVDGVAADGFALADGSMTLWLPWTRWLGVLVAPGGQLGCEMSAQDWLNSDLRCFS